MSEMGQRVATTVARIEAHHQALKLRRWGFLVRPVTLILGWLIVAVGLITIPFPGPGWLTVFVGVGVLALEVKFAKRLLDWGIRQYERFFAWFRSQSRSTRTSVVVATFACAWIAVGGTALGLWSTGNLPALDPVIQAMID